MDKAIRAMLIGAGLPVKFWPYAFRHFLRIKNSALPRRDATESAHQKLHGKKDNLGLLRTFGCCLWVKILAWQNRAKYIQDTKKGIFLGYRTNTLKNVAWYDPLTDRVKSGYHVWFNEGVNDLPLSKLPPNVVLMDWREERVPAEVLTITIPPFITSEHPFFHEDDVTVKAVCGSNLYGFELREDDCMKRVYILDFKKDVKGVKSRRSCNTVCSTERVTRRKYCGVYITAIDNEEIVTLDQAKEKLEELRNKKVDSFTMILAREPKPSKSMTRRAYDELELPDFDLDENLGEDYFAPGGNLEGDSSMTTSHTTGAYGTDYVPTIGTKIHKDFGTKGFFAGTVTSGPHICTMNGDDLTVWKVQYADGDREDMTASEIAYWKAPAEEALTSKTKAKSKRPKKTIAMKPSGDRSEELEDVIPKPGKDASAPTHLRQSTCLQQHALETARMYFLDNNPYLPMDSIGMHEAATCRIHLCNDDPYEELLHKVDEVETLLQHPVVLAAIHRLLDPDADLDKLRMSALQSEVISPEECALPRFSRRALKRLPTWDLWHKNELEQLDQMKALGMFRAPIKVPEGGILMRFHWQYQIKVNGK